MNKTKGLDFIKRYTMILVLIVVTAFFAPEEQSCFP